MKPTKTDILIIAALLIVVTLFLPTDGDNKKLYLISETEKKHIPLGEQLIKLDDGDVLIKVTDEGAKFLESDCPNKTCIKTGWVKKCGEVSACVPNRYALVMECGEDEYDAISQ